MTVSTRNFRDTAVLLYALSNGEVLVCAIGDWEQQGHTSTQ